MAKHSGGRQRGGNIFNKKTVTALLLLLAALILGLVLVNKKENFKSSSSSKTTTRQYPLDANNNFINKNDTSKIYKPDPILGTADTPDAYGAAQLYTCGFKNCNVTDNCMLNGTCPNGSTCYNNSHCSSGNTCAGSNWVGGNTGCPGGRCNQGHCLQLQNNSGGVSDLKSQWGWATG